jgi:prepilin-type N-terminal cleavage/methylation domain-containing protein
LATFLQFLLLFFNVAQHILRDTNLKILKERKHMLTKTKLKGFTIIEVVLVLAIAGLIFMMVFIALPALQRSQRDTQRKNDMARMQTAIVNFQSNNHNRLPDDDYFEDSCGDGIGGAIGTGEAAVEAGGFCANYLLVGGDSFQDPDGNAYDIVVGGDANTTFGSYEVHIWRNSYCDGEIVKPITGAVNKVALTYKLEGGGTICLNN